MGAARERVSLRRDYEASVSQIRVRNREGQAGSRCRVLKMETKVCGGTGYTVEGFRKSLGRGDAWIRVLVRCYMECNSHSSSLGSLHVHLLPLPLLCNPSRHLLLTSLPLMVLAFLLLHITSPYLLLLCTLPAFLLFHHSALSLASASLHTSMVICCSISEEVDIVCSC